MASPRSAPRLRVPIVVLLATALVTGCAALFTGCSALFTGCSDLQRFGPIVSPPSGGKAKVFVWSRSPERLRLQPRGSEAEQARLPLEQTPTQAHRFLVSTGSGAAETRFTIGGVADASRSESTRAAYLGGRIPATHATPGEPLRVVAIGDSGPIGIQPHPQWQIAELAASLRPDLTLHLGDIVYGDSDGDPEAEVCEAFFAPFAPLLSVAPFAPVMGNHDRHGGRLAYAKFFGWPRKGPFDYSFDQGPIHFVALDTSLGPELSADQRAWLQADLAASRARWKVVYTHYPPRKADGSGAPRDPPGLAALETICQEGGVHLLLCGHEHAYLRYRRRVSTTGRSLPLVVVSGGGGADVERRLEPDPRLRVAMAVRHVLLLQAWPDRLVVRAIGLDGAVLDRAQLDR